MSRHLPFEGIDNFRDFGGYATMDGGRLVSGRLFRSGHHAAATEVDLARLAALDVTTIVDLRHPEERSRDPCRRWENFGAEVIESDVASDAPAWIERLRGRSLTPELFLVEGVAGYGRNAFDPRHVDLFRRFLKAAAEKDGPLVIHCHSGKDRTGLACALLHRLAGVHHDDLMADYLLTNDETKVAMRIEGARAYLERELGESPSDAALRVAVGVSPEYLDAAFDSMTNRCGSVEGYVEQVLGLGAEFRDKLHPRVLG